MDERTDIQVVGMSELAKRMDALLTSNPAMEKEVKKIIRTALLEVVRLLQNDASSGLQMKSDPRSAYKAIRMAVYRQILGGNVNILRGRRSNGGGGSGIYANRTLSPGQRGGNRRSRSPRTEALDGYMGEERGFILRFLNAGAYDRKIKDFVVNDKRKRNEWNKNPNTGNRGSIEARNWFGPQSTDRMQNAAEKIAQGIDALIRDIMEEGHTIQG